MAQFIGTAEEFYTYIGPRVRNHLQRRTKPIKEELGYHCQRCHKVRKLEAVHIKPSTFKSVCTDVVGRHLVERKKGIAKVDLVEIDNEIIEAHQPFKRKLRFYCRGCHDKYDGRQA